MGYHIFNWAGLFVYYRVSFLGETVTLLGTSEGKKKSRQTKMFSCMFIACRWMSHTGLPIPSKRLVSKQPRAHSLCKSWPFRLGFQLLFDMQYCFLSPCIDGLLSLTMLKTRCYVLMRETEGVHISHVSGVNF